MGGKKKKGLSNRLAKMSDEERARYLQHRAAVEEEAKRRKEQLISTYMKNKIKREEAFTRLNIAKINEHWHQTLRKIKVQQLKAEVADLSTWITKTLEIKNSTIKRLVEELDEAEEQYVYNFKSHTSALDNLLEIHYCIQQELYENYESSRNSIVEKGMEYLERLRYTWDKERSYLKTIIFTIESNVEKEQKELLSSRQEKIDDFTNTCKANRETMEAWYHDAMDKIWKDINSTLREYLSATNVRRHHYIELKHLDDRNTAQRLQNDRLIVKYKKSLETLKNDYKLLSEKKQNEVLQLTELHENLSKHLARAKQNLTDSIRKDENQLRILTVNSNSSIKTFEKICSEYKNIQKLLMCCQKLETHSDTLRFNKKLLQLKEEWVSDVPSIKENEEEDKVEIADNSIALGDNEPVVTTASHLNFMKDLEIMDKLDLIVWRCSVTELDTLLLKNEKTRLMMENNNLKKIIKGVIRDATMEPTYPPKNKIIDSHIKSAPIKLTRKFSPTNSSQPSFIIVDL